jgi:ATP-dependent Clp protease adaptor protein ClpS
MPVDIRPGNRTRQSSKTEKEFKEPDDYQVVLLNDNYTTMDFVVEVLMSVFHKNTLDAERIMMDIHRKVKGILVLYTYDIALTKANQVHELAREKEFPLRCIVEKQ